MDEETSIFQKPIFKRLVGFAVFIIAYLLIGPLLKFTGDTADHTMQMTGDAFLCMGGLAAWMVFFAQFVLPVNKLKDRFKVIERLVSYLMGTHGPAIFVENGFARAREGEGRKRGPGVIWLDSASAATLRTAGRFTRTVGPGVHFTRYNEYIAATVDLHTLKQEIGPDDNDEPFKVVDKTQEGEAAYKAMKERAELTNAMTRDGIIISAIITINFRIKSIPGEGGTRFGFDQKNTEAAIRDSLVRELSVDGRPVWNTLPARMAADIWREYLGKFRLNELFDKRDTSPETTIQFISSMMKKRLTRSRVELLDGSGQVMLEDKNREAEYLHLLQNKKNDAAEALLKKTESLEYIKLSEMGLEVTNVFIRKLFFSPDVEEQLISQWTTLWMKNARKEREQVERERNARETLGQQEAIKDFAQFASKDISEKHTSSPAHALERLIHATMLGAIRRGLGPIVGDISEIYAWLKGELGLSE